MRAEELKIGNRVLFLGEVVTVECVDNLPERPDMYWLKVKEQPIKHKIFQFKPIPLTEERLLKMGFEKKQCITLDWKHEYVIKIDGYAWELGFLIGDYPITNPNIGCLSILQSEDEEFNSVPADLVHKEVWTKEDEVKASSHVEVSKAWRQPIAYGISYLHQLQNLIFALTGQELTIKE